MNLLRARPDIRSPAFRFRSLTLHFRYDDDKKLDYQVCLLGAKSLKMLVVVQFFPLFVFVCVACAQLGFSYDEKVDFYFVTQLRAD